MVSSFSRGQSFLRDYPSNPGSAGVLRVSNTAEQVTRHKRDMGVYYVYIHVFCVYTVYIYIHVYNIYLYI